MARWATERLSAPNRSALIVGRRDTEQRTAPKEVGRDPRGVRRVSGKEGGNLKTETLGEKEADKMEGKATMSFRIGETLVGKALEAREAGTRKVGHGTWEISFNWEMDGRRRKVLGRTRVPMEADFSP